MKKGSPAAHVLSRPSDWRARPQSRSKEGNAPSASAFAWASDPTQRPFASPAASRLYSARHSESELRLIRFLLLAATNRPERYCVKCPEDSLSLIERDKVERSSFRSSRVEAERNELRSTLWTIQATAHSSTSIVMSRVNSSSLSGRAMRKRMTYCFEPLGRWSLP